MKVNEIFTSIEGEGARSGLLSTFIRLYGCNLNCTYCDSRYSCDSKEYTEMSPNEIVDEVIDRRINRVTITGGEPLIHPSFDVLLPKLMALPDMQVNIETNGSIPLDSKMFSRHRVKRLMVTMDWKSISSGESSTMIQSNLDQLNHNDVLKFVVGDRKDLMQMYHLITGTDIEAQIFVSPVFGKIELAEIVDFLKEYNLQDVRMQLQMHKIIWDPNKRGV